MTAPADPASPQPQSLAAAVQSFVSARIAAAPAGTPNVAPEDAQIWGTIGSLMGLTKAERQERRQEILAAFLTAWIDAGGVPRTTSAKKARVEKRKQTIKQIKTRRAAIEKIAAANQKERLPAKPVAAG